MKNNQFEKFEIKKADLVKVKGGGQQGDSTGSGRFLDEQGLYCDTLYVYPDRYIIHYYPC